LNFSEEALYSSELVKESGLSAVSVKR